MMTNIGLILVSDSSDKHSLHILRISYGHHSIKQGNRR